MKAEGLWRFAIYLRQSRLSSGLSQAAVARQLGYETSQFISNWERGLAVPPMRVMKKLAKLYQISLDDIFAVLLKAQTEHAAQKLKQALGLST